MYELTVNGRMLSVWCNMSILGEGGWTIIQRRINGDLSFNETWLNYRNGFGRRDGDHWLGLQNIRDILSSSENTFQLYVGMGSFHPTDTFRFSLYHSFSIGDERDNYTLSVGGLEAGTAGDSLLLHNGHQFSTLDRDNDSARGTHCARVFGSGWWYHNCHDSLLNGQWYGGGLLRDLNFPDGIIWETWAGDRESLKTTMMAIRPVV